MAAGSKIDIQNDDDNAPLLQTKNIFNVRRNRSWYQHKDKDGPTALIIAGCPDHGECLKELIATGADTRINDKG